MTAKLFIIYSLSLPRKKLKLIVAKCLTDRLDCENKKFKKINSAFNKINLSVQLEDLVKSVHYNVLLVLSAIIL